MKPPPFAYAAPKSVEEALDLLAEHGADAKILAGGQSLIPTMNFRLANAALLIDLNRIEPLAYIKLDGDHLRIGAMTRQRTLERDKLVAKHAPLLFEAMPHIAHPQIRNRGTIGGSLAHADPAAELPVIMVALGAEFVIRGKNNERTVSATDFFQGLFTTDLQPDELLAEIAVPVKAKRTGYAFLEVARRHGDYAMMGVAASLTLDSKGKCESARLVYLNAADKPAPASQAAAMLAGQSPEADLFQSAAQQASEEIDPMGNLHASVDFQRHLARVLTVKALATARDRAKG